METLQQITEASHARSVGDAAKRTSLSTVGLAQSDTEANLAWAVIALIQDADHYLIATRQGTVFYWPSHGLGDIRDLGYLSQSSAGLIVSTKPSTGLVQALVRVIDSNTVELLDPNRTEDV